MFRNSEEYCYGFLLAAHVEPHLLLKISFVLHEGLEHIPTL